MEIRSDNMRGALLMAAAMAAFTVNDTFMKLVTADVPLFQAILLRGLTTLVLLLVVARYLGGLKLRLGRRDAVIVAIRSLGEVAGTATFLTALQHMPLANLSAIMQSLPLAVTLVAALVLKERVGWRRMAAIVVGFAGVMLIVRPGPEGFDFWALIGIASVACVVVRDLSTRQLSSAVPSVTVAFYSAVAVTLMGAVVVPIQGWKPLDIPAAMTIFGAAAFLIVGYITSVMTMRVGDIAVVAPFRYTALIFALGLGWLFFGEFPDALTLAGAAIIIATGVYTFYRERRLNRLTATPVGAPFQMR